MPPSSLSEESTPWGLVMILLGAGIFSAFQVGKVPPVLPLIRSDLGISLFQSGWILSIFNFTGLLLGICAGAIADVLGHRRLMLTGLLLQAAGSLAGSFSPGLEWLLITRFLEGAGFLAVIVSVPTLIFQVVRQRDLKIAMSVWTCYLPAGAALMMAILPLILDHLNWTGLWRLNSGILLFYGLVAAKATSHIQFMNAKASPGLFNNILLTIQSPGPLVLALIFITYALQWLAVMGFLPTLLLDRYGFTPGMASLLTGLVVFGNILGNLAGGRILQAGAVRWQVIAGASFAMGLCALAIYSKESHFILSFGGCLLFSAVGGLIPASVLGGTPVYAPSKNLISTTNGLIIQGGQSGQLLGPPILAWLVSRTNTWECGFWFLGSVALTGVLLSFCLSRIRKD